MGAFRHMNGDRLLRDSCSWQAYSSSATDATTGAQTPSYSAAVTLRCMVGTPSRRWQLDWPATALNGAKEFWLPHASTVTVRDKITHGGLAYEVVAVADWEGAAFSVLAQIQDERLQ